MFSTGRMTMTPTILPELHDAVLVSMTLRWEDGGIELVVRPASKVPQNVTLRMSGLTRFVCGRSAPWGFSRHINRVIGPSCRADAVQQLQIEMQSGDMIEIDYVDLDIA